MNIHEGVQASAVIMVSAIHMVSAIMVSAINV